MWGVVGAGRSSRNKRWSTRGPVIWQTIAREGTIMRTTRGLVMLPNGLDGRTPMPSWKSEIAAAGGADDVEDDTPSANAAEEKARRRSPRPLPEDLPQREVEHLLAEGCACSPYGGALRGVSEDVTESRRSTMTRGRGRAARQRDHREPDRTAASAGPLRRNFPIRRAGAAGTRQAVRSPEGTSRRDRQSRSRTDPRARRAAPRRSRPARR